MRPPILKLSLSEQIVEQLRNDVLCGRLAQGVKLSEEDLAKQFGVSRTPIRQAIQQLTYEGLLKGRLNAGVTVSSPPPDSIAELVVPIRKIVETFALRTIYDSLTEEDFQAWDALLEKMRQACLARDYHTIAEMDIAFHRSIIKRTGQEDLMAIWSALISRVRHHFHETQSRDYDDPLAIYHEHRALVDIFKKGDREAAVEALFTEGIT